MERGLYRPRGVGAMMTRSRFALVASLSLLAIPSSSAASGDVLQVMECDALAGTGLVVVSTDHLSDGNTGVGGCSLGISEHNGLADIDQPPGCVIRYGGNDDFLSGQEVEDEVVADYELVAWCDLGVVDAHITLKIIEP